jgi:DNA-binding MarR family transcriptional regulator
MAELEREITAVQDVDRLEQQILIALRRIIRGVDLHSRRLLLRCGLTGPQLIVLREVARLEAASIGELASVVSLSQPTVTGIVARLELRGLVTRRRSETDRRRVLVTTTAEGTRLAHAELPLLQESFLDQLAGLESWEQTQLLASLQRVVAMMEAQQLEAGPFLTNAINPQKSG